MTPNIRSEAKADNAAAASRRNSINVSVSRYFNYGARWQVNVTNINNGRALIVLKHRNGRTLKTWSAQVSGNRLSFRTGRPDCQGPRTRTSSSRTRARGVWARARVSAPTASRSRCAS